jgi:hypothetical protein
VKVLAVIVNHKRPELVLRGLKSLAALEASAGGCRAIVADASGDESPQPDSFMKKHLADAAWALGFLSGRALRRFQGKTDDERPHLPSDFVRFNFLDG